MSNIFLSTAFIYLASEQVGCIVSNEDGEDVVETNCDTLIYGVFKPASLVTNIATIAGIIIAFTLPFVGALLDSSDYRWSVGVITAIGLMSIQAIQIATTSQTWFGMAIIQTIGALLLQTQVLSGQAYLPEISRHVDEATMNRCK